MEISDCSSNSGYEGEEEVDAIADGEVKNLSHWKRPGTPLSASY